MMFDEVIAGEARVLWVAVVLGLLLVLYFALYRRALADMRDLTNFALLLLLNDDIRKVQRDGLLTFVRVTEAGTTKELCIKVNLSVIQLANRLRDTKLGTCGMLWNARKEAIAPVLESRR